MDIERVLFGVKHFLNSCLNAANHRSVRLRNKRQDEFRGVKRYVTFAGSDWWISIRFAFNKLIGDTNKVYIKMRKKNIKRNRLICTN